MALKRRITFPKGLRDSGLHFTLFLALIGAATACAGKKAALAEPGVIGVPGVSIVQDQLALGVDPQNGSLLFLSDRPGGYNYAGYSGLWRLYYNTPDRKEIEIRAADCTPVVTANADTIYIDYSGIGGKAFELHLRIWAQDNQAHFGATVVNDEPHTIIRELQYPLIGNLHLPSDYKLLTTHTGGQIFDDPVQKIANVDTRALYMTPAQKFRQYDLQYPRNAAANCFAFVGEEDGLYFGSHDTSLQQTWHGLRAYPDGAKAKAGGSAQRACPTPDTGRGRGPAETSSCGARTQETLGGAGASKASGVLSAAGCLSLRKTKILEGVCNVRH